MPRLDEEMDDVQKLFEDPSYIKEKQKKNDAPIKTKQHVVGLVNRGHILGMEESNYGNS